MKNNFVNLISLFIIFLFISTGCNKDTAVVNEELLTDQQKTAEKEAITQTLKSYNQAANEKNWSKIVSTLADEVTFFGTDSGEVSKNFNEFKNTMQTQWNDYDVLVYGDVENMFIELDDYARYCNVIYGSPLIFGKKGETPDTIYTVCQRTLKKDQTSKKWVISSGILAISRVAH